MLPSSTLPFKNTRTYSVMCVGVSPILMNPFTFDELEAIRTKKEEPFDPSLRAADIVARKVLRDPVSGAIGIPSGHLMACMVTAGVQVTYSGRKKLSVKGRPSAEQSRRTSRIFVKSSRVPAVMIIGESFLPFTNLNGGQGWIVDKRGVPNPKGPGHRPHCRVRPRFDKWEFTATLITDADQIHDSTVRKLMEVAGQAIGVGDCRPEMGGECDCGKFEVAAWNVVNG